MPKVQFPVTSLLARSLLIVAVVAYALFTWQFLRWEFAHAISSGAGTVEVADLSTQISPSDPQTHFTAAVLHDRTFDPGDAAKALDEYAAAASLAPSDHRYWIDYGKALERSGDRDAAERALEYALGLAPHYADVLWALGNVRVRLGNIDGGLGEMATAAEAKPIYMRPAIVTAMQFLDGDRRRVIEAFGDKPAFNAEIALFLADAEKYDEAFEMWNAIPAQFKSSELKETGEKLQAKFLTANKVRMAATIAGDLRTTNAPIVGAVFDGGFELPLRFKDSAVFYWQIGDGSVPQVGLSNSQKHGGGFSLYLIFETMLAADMRQIAQTIAVEPQTPYVFECYTRSELQGAVAWEIVSIADGQVIARAPIAPSAEWARSQAVFTTPPGVDGVSIRLARDGCVASVCPISGKLWVDDVAISQKR